jgi:hypothetical protein
MRDDKIGNIMVSDFVIEYKYFAVAYRSKPYTHNGNTIGHPVRADYRSYYHAPAIRGMYHLFTKDKLIYIGISDNLQRRLKEHYRNDNLDFQYFLTFDCSNMTREELEQQEELMIRTLNPPMNGHAHKRPKNKTEKIYELVPTNMTKR